MNKNSRLILIAIAAAVATLEILMIFNSKTPMGSTQNILNSIIAVAMLIVIASQFAVLGKKKD